MITLQLVAAQEQNTQSYHCQSLIFVKSNVKIVQKYKNIWQVDHLNKKSILNNFLTF